MKLALSDSPSRPHHKGTARPLTCLLAASAVLVAGCGGSKPSPTTTKPPASDPVKTEKAKAAVFQPSDLPAGWKATPEEEDGKPTGLSWSACR